MIDRLDGKIELALAAYNAGPTRALAWRNWAEFREPAEFIETIPFTETREYVQTVLRNADVYRRLYAGPIRASNE
jgi:soluble lytic murein transglycosylase